MSVIRRDREAAVAAVLRMDFVKVFGSARERMAEQIVGVVLEAAQPEGAVEALREIAERTDVPADFSNAVVRLRWVHERASNAIRGR